SLVGDDSVTVKSLPAGEYTVTPANSWTWRFADMAAEDVTLRGQAKTVSFGYTNPIIRWLSGHADDSFTN
ncbi:MAG: hypothetical protein IKV55_04920, partial [Oscillospiraceae bacterium]|nr:hypothetical protein [Oscillospiraceae bacterium]